MARVKCGLARRRPRFILATALGLFCFLASTGSAQSTNPPPQILFLHVKIKNQQVTLLETTTRPGVVKPMRAGSPDELQFEMLSADGTSLWSAAVPDPTIRVVEFEDPPGSGNLKRKSVPVDDVEFTVRVPVTASAQHVDFFKLEPAAGSAQLSTPAPPAKKMLGSVTLP